MKIIKENLNEASPIILNKDQLNDPKEINFSKIIDDNDAEEKRQNDLKQAASIQQKALSGIDSGESNIEDNLNSLFERLVPASGYADTLAGELIRAIVRIIYRFYNDGDIFYDGYGTETCGSSAAFIMAKLPDTKEIFENVALNQYSEDDDRYLEGMQKVASLILEELQSKVDLFIPGNTQDSRNYTISKEQLSWTPEYTFDCDFSGEYIQQALDNHLIDSTDLYEFTRNVVSGISYGAQIRQWALDGIEVTDLTKDELAELERQWYKEIESWGEELADQLEEEDEEYEDIEESLNSDMIKFYRGAACLSENEELNEDNIDNSAFNRTCVKYNVSPKKLKSKLFKK